MGVPTAIINGRAGFGTAEAKIGVLPTGRPRARLSFSRADGL
jgi:hypothetical protein